MDAFEGIKFLWAIVLLPLGWLWARIRDLEKREMDTPTRQEMKEEIRAALEPLRHSLDRIDNFLIKHDEKEVIRYDTLIQLLTRRTRSEDE